MNVQTTREQESNIVFVWYQFSKRFLVGCKIFVLSFSNFYSLVIICRLFSFSWVTFPQRSHGATLSVLSSYFHSCSVTIRKFFPSWDLRVLSDLSLGNVLCLAKQIPTACAKRERFRNLRGARAAFRFRWVKSAGNVKLRLLCRSCVFLPLLVIADDFIAGQGKVFCFYEGLL